MEKEGYRLVLKPEIALREFEVGDWIIKYQKEYRELRKAFARFDPKKYRGISRYSVEAYPSMDERAIQAFSSTGLDMDSNRKARIEMYKMLKDEFGSNKKYSIDLLKTKESASAVFKLLDIPENYEIICTRRIDFIENTRILGFDIGYWGGDRFSLIADTIIMPTWHIPDEEDYVELAEKLSILNENLLFKAPGEAEYFRNYYKSKSWAETEGYEGQFCIIQVELVPLN